MRVAKFSLNVAFWVFVLVICEIFAVVFLLLDNVYFLFLFGSLHLF